MAKNDVNSWDENADQNTDVGGTSIAEGCPPGNINNAIRMVMAQIKAWYLTVPRLSANNTFSGSNSFSGANTFIKLISSVSSASGASTRGVSLIIDGTEQTRIYHDNTRTVLTSTNQGFRFDSPTNFNGVAVRQSAGSAQDANLKGYRLSVDGNEQASLVHENTGAVFATTGYFRTVVGGTEIERITPTGVGVGIALDKSSPDDTGNGVFLRTNGLVWANATDAACGLFKRTGSNGDVLRLVRGTTQVGSISVTLTGTAFNTTSDARLKEDFKQIPEGSLDAVNVYDFAWKNSPLRGYGVKAQELISVYPEAVKDGESEGDMMSVNYSWFIPMLIAEVKALRKRVKDLES